MSFYFIKSGLQTSLQDGGRPGFMDQGVPASGAMDPFSMKLANWLVGNEVNSVAIEVCLIGPVILIEEDVVIAICGACFEIELNGNLITNNQAIATKSGDILRFGQRIAGARAYIAFSGQLTIDTVFASHSTHVSAGLGGFKHRSFIDSDRLVFIPNKQLEPKKLKNPLQVHYSGNYLLRCVKSIETGHFTRLQKQQFYSQRYQVSPDSNRMGIRLMSSPIIFETTFDIVSSGLTQGSIQIPPSGLAIISSVDGQTIGGYPRIATIISSDLKLLGQLVAGDRLAFVNVTQKYAIEALNRSREIEKEILCDS